MIALHCLNDQCSRNKPRKNFGLQFGASLLGLIVASLSPLSLANAQSLPVALQGLLNNSSTIEAARQAHFSAQKSADAVRIRLYPRLTLNASLAQTNKDDRIVRRINDHNGHTKFIHEVELTARQELFSGFSDVARIEKADFKTQRTAAQLEGVIQSELSNGIRAYFDVLLGSFLLRSIEESLLLSKQIVEARQKQNKDGGGSEAAVIKAEKTLLNQQVSHANQQRRRARAIGQYIRYFGIAPDIKTMDFHEIGDAQLPVSLEDTLAEAQKSPDVVAGFLRAEMLGAQIKATAASHYPTIALALSYSTDNDTFLSNADNTDIELSHSRETRLELSLKWDLTAALFNQDAVDSARARASSEKSKARAFTKRVAGRTTTAWDSYQYYQSELDALEEMLDREDRLIKIAADGGTSLKKLGLQLRRERTVQRHLRTQIGLQQAKAELLALSGRLNTEP